MQPADTMPEGLRYRNPTRGNAEPFRINAERGIPQNVPRFKMKFLHILKAGPRGSAEPFRIMGNAEPFRIMASEGQA